MTVLIADAKELLNILSLAMTDLHESIKKLLPIAPLKLSVDIIIMSGSCNGYRFHSGTLGFLIQTPFIGCLIAEKCVL
ncbi:unnamed protein product [Heligmosomoides polygyrus]|uniref:AraC family transcriptional regulator n=1 Tax=Heligmosomoides polygyrus TaxID=6339 RepID=A0A183F5S4_HELPZ|nr:unnamed protein product [Heligmosomoides polygyrus]